MERTEMAADLGWIVLRDIPKEQARLDNAVYPIQGGFRGFDCVPAGPHYVGVVDQGQQYGFWCYLDILDVVVKVFDSTRKVFVDDQPESTERYASLAMSGAMGNALRSPHPQAFETWSKLTNHISEDDFPPTLYPAPGQTANRFVQAFSEVHGGDVDAFLAEFQFAFASWYTNPANSEPLKRWAHLLQSVYNAGERNMASNPELFAPLVDTMLTQFTLIRDEEFSPQSAIGFGVNYLTEDLIDTEIPSLVEKGKALESYLASRGLS
ncbi:MAG: AAR2 pre-mRNA splicing protein [Spirulina sp. SIO3F2]|nr:AAR2 pre-mRNA splicing protein [Spirulina sp. SIO3F2]